MMKHSVKKTMIAIFLCILLLADISPAFAGESVKAGPQQTTGQAGALTEEDGTDISSGEEPAMAAGGAPGGAAGTGGSSGAGGAAGSDAPAVNGASQQGNEAAADVSDMGEGSPSEYGAPAAGQPAGKQSEANAAVQSKKGASLSEWTPEQGLPSLKGVSLTILNGSQILVKWKTNSKFEGYEVSYARNILFLRAKKKKVKDPAINNLTLSGLNTNKRYYIRVRAYRKYEGDLYCTDWVRKNTSQADDAAAIRFVTVGGKKVDIRKQAGKALKEYTVSQGTCSDGKHLYMCFEYRRGDDNGSGRARIKIAKVRISDWKLLKVSPSGQKLGHANDITYNANRNILVVTGAKKKDPYVRIVSPKTLKKTGTKKVNLGKKYRYVNAFNAIDYDPESHTYYIRSRNFSGMSFTLDENFRFMSVASIFTLFPTRSVQSCTSLGDIFIIPQAQDQSSSKNSITIFKKTGECLQHIKIKLKGELESVFMIGNQLYATVHKHVNRHYKTGYIFRILL